jgi:ferric-dicitrate binding protein FerR (iron transport regulator)
MVSPSGNRGEVKVLGTHFNIKAFDDENDTKVTLLEGSVEVSGPEVNGIHEGAILVPGRQLSIFPQGSMRTQIVDVEQTVAWKNGLFDYTSSNITQVLRDAARWYDIEIAYEGNKPNDTFTGGIPRSASLTELLTILQMSRVRFKLEGKKLTVLK